MGEFSGDSVGKPPPPPTSQCEPPLYDYILNSLYSDEYGECFSLSLFPGAVSTSDIQVFGCGVVSWEPPANTGGEMPGYVIRFFDGDTYETSTYREIQRYFDDPGRQWAVAANLPSTRPIYADVCYYAHDLFTLQAQIASVLLPYWTFSK